MSDFGFLLAVVILIPIAAATLPLIASLRYEKVGWHIAAVSLAVNLVLTAVAVRAFFVDGKLRHELGGIPVPHGIELVMDGLSVLVVLLVSVVALAVLVHTRTAGPRSNAFYSAYLLLTGGLLGVSLTGDLFNLYVFIEITGLAAYALIASKGDGKSAYSALKYMLIGTVGASLYLIGVGYAFIATGTLNMVDLSVQFQELGYGDTLVLTSFGFIIAGLAVKTALFPVHTWQPDAYSAAPYGVAGYVSALVSTVSAYVIGRVILTVYTTDFIAANPVITSALVYFGALSIVVGSVLAVTQADVKKMLAYSSVSQFGMIVAAFGIANSAAVFGGVIQLIGHAIMKGALFLGAGILAYKVGAKTVYDYEGISFELPYASAGFATLALALVGVPPAVGFIGKWYVGLGAVQGGYWIVAVVIFGSTLLTLAYVLRLVDRMYFGKPERGAAEAVADGGVSASTKRVTVGMVALVCVAAVVSVVLGPSAAWIESLLRLEEVMG